MTKQKTYRVSILGRTWEGFMSSYDYSFDHMPTFDEIRGKAGDFQSVTDYRIVSTQREGTWEHEITSRTVEREWENEDSDNEFMLTNGF